MALADLVLTGGSGVEALAVREGRIAAVGTTGEIHTLVDPRTRVLELGGKTVLPGFQDAHLHPPHGGLSKLQCDLHDCLTREECLAAIARFTAEHGEDEWIVGDGWSMDSFAGGTPSREDLDAVVGGRPAFLTNRDGHGAWVNSRALALASVDAQTADPPDGRIERDPTGAPQGTLHEGAMKLVERLLPATTAQEWEEGIRLAQAEIHGLGITAWQDATVTAETLAAYRALAERGELTMRTEGNLLWDRGRGEEQVDELVELRGRRSLGRLRIRGAKIFQDGVAENFTAAMLEPYLGERGAGLSMHEPEELARMVTLLDGHGFQVHVHTIGDRAVRESLDAVEAAQAANGRRDARHHLAHIQFVHPDDVPRFRQLGVVANAQPYWACREAYVTELTEPFVGAERVAYMYPFGSLHRAGARLAFGSDWTVSTPDPLQQLEVAVNRIRPDDRGAEPLHKEEALELETALAAFTSGSAYVNFLEKETGTLEPGKLADLVVLDRALFEIPGAHVADARVLLTLVEGEAVYADPELSW
ncbi:MAG TPA: amidohydrolase [Gaiellaceae bacterium]|nr:amidohydrolase [Gaiellaceae bacterium]